MDPRDYPQDYLPPELLKQLAEQDEIASGSASPLPNDQAPPQNQEPPIKQQPAPQSAKTFATFELPGTSQPSVQHSAAPSTEVAQAPTENASYTPPVSQQQMAEFSRQPMQSTAQKGRLLQKAKVLKEKSKSKLSNLKQTDKTEFRKRLKPFIGAAIVGALIFGVFNSQIILGQFQYLLGPETEPTTPAAISVDNRVSPEPLIIIPKINLSAPVVYDEKSFSENAIQKALERGVVHYGTTALPGQKGNNVIVGHSSNNWWASGKYKFAFVLLNKLKVGDTFSLHYNSTKYTYEVFEKKIIEPNDLSVISQQVDEPIVTLITCDPPGTSWKRLVVVARQISPKFSEADTSRDASVPSAIDSPLPGYGESFWEKLNNWLFN